MQALAFRPRLDRIDAVLLERTRERRPQTRLLEDAMQEQALSLFELFPPQGGGLGGHYGKVARSLWTLVDHVFKAADHPDDCPPGFSAKSVQVADVYEAPPTTTSRTTFLVLWAAQDEPILVPCPQLPKVLLVPESARLAATRRALHGVVWEVTERLNLVAPAALALAAQRVRAR